MHESVAQVRPRNLEKARVNEIVPDYVINQSIRRQATGFIAFLEEYYDYLNREGYPSYELDHFTIENDIDETSSTYLDAIQGEIAKVVPNSDYMDRVTLYKRIVNYYRSKGTKEAVNTFFRIFYNTTVTVEYANEPWTYKVIPEEVVLGDNFLNNFKKLVHPAGLKFIIAVLYELTVTPGILAAAQNASEVQRVIRILLGPTAAVLTAAQNGSLVVKSIFSQTTEGRNSFARRDYQHLLKFLDTGAIINYTNYTIAQAEEVYSPFNAFPMLNIPTEVTLN